MNMLQRLITAKLEEGKTLRGIARESGVSHVSIGKYHEGSKPNARSMAMLAKYFGVDYDSMRKSFEGSDIAFTWKVVGSGNDDTGPSGSDLKVLRETLQSLPACKIKKLLHLLNVLESDD